MKIMANALTERERARLLETAAAVLPWVSTAEWQLIEEYPNCVRATSPDGLRVIAEVEMQETHRVLGNDTPSRDLWLHVSFSRTDRVPSYDDMVRVKERFIGPARKAIQVLPPESEHYNHMPFCLNLFSSLDYDPLPDLRTRHGKL
jgi:hypothetical protein